MLLEKTSPGANLATLLRKLKEQGLVLGNDSWLAGGAIRRAVCGHPIEEGDLDIYTTDDKILSFDQASRDHGWELQVPKLAVRQFRVNGIVVQLHTKYGEKVGQILRSFDFTCCQMACDGKQVVYVPPAIEHARQMRLEFTGNFGAGTLARAFRLQAMGFKPSKRTLADMERFASLATFTGEEFIDEFGRRRVRATGRS